ncbi:MAG: TolC family protein [Desulfobulbaceae bacterium]|nr:TolC family protein [Desulfobulbaceae bacterium]
MKLFNLVLIILLLADAAGAASLKELQHKAVTNREIIARYEANLKRSEQNLRLARSSYYPSMDISYSMSNLKDETLYESSENSVVSGAVSWNLFSGFKDKYNIQSAELEQKAEDLRLAGIKQDIQLDVALQYVFLFNQKANLQVTRDYHAALEKMYQDGKNRYDVGLIKKNDLLKIKVDLDNALIDLKRAEAGVKKGIQLLQRGINDVVQFDQLQFREFDQQPVLDRTGDYEAEMLAKRSEVQVVKELIKAADAQVRAQYAGYYPKVDLVSSYQKYDDHYLNGSGSDGGSSLLSGSNDEEIRTQLVLSVNLFDGFGKSAKIGMVKNEMRALKHELGELESELRTELKNLFYDFEVSGESVQVAETGISQAEENVRVTKLSYQEGLVTETDMLDAAANLSRAHENYVAAKSDVFANYFKILRAVEGF